MTKNLATLATVLVTSTAFFCVTVASPASAAPDTKQCVSRAELRQVEPGMSMSKVRQIVNGQKSLNFAPNRREYRACFSEPGTVECMILLTKADGTRVKSKRVYLCQASFEA